MINSIEIVHSFLRFTFTLMTNSIRIHQPFRTYGPIYNFLLTSLKLLYISLKFLIIPRTLFNSNRLRIIFIRRLRLCIRKRSSRFWLDAWLFRRSLGIWCNRWRIPLLIILISLTIIYIITLFLILATLTIAFTLILTLTFIFTFTLSFIFIFSFTTTIITTNYMG